MLLEEETQKKYGYKIDSLKFSSDKLCLLVCDYCKILFERKYSKVNVGRKNIDKDACNNIQCQTLKRKDIYLKLFGVDHPSKHKETKEKRKQTNIKRFGVENVFQSEQIKEKIINTNLLTYGVENVSNSPEIIKKKKQTMLKKYGVEFALQNKEIHKKQIETMNNIYGQEYYGKFQKINFDVILSICKEKNYKPLFSECDYKNKKEMHNFLCLKHNIQFESSIMSMKINNHQCPECKIFYCSSQEQEIFDFIVSLGVEKEKILRNDRKTIGRELDLYLPEYNLAIEHHGLYYHSDQFKERELHYDKFFLSKEKNINLLQFYEDEWKEKNDICKSIIAANLGLNKNKINARDCYMLEIRENKEMKRKVIDFIDENHLQGNCSGTLRYFALLTKQNNEIVSCLSIRKTMNTKSRKDEPDVNIEIARFCNKKFCNVRGSFSKLLKYMSIWTVENGYKKIFTYSDCRYSWGDVYEKHNFEYKGHTGISFYYLYKNKRYARFPVALLQEGKTLEELSQENGIYRIYNAGNYRWELSILK